MDGLEADHVHSQLHCMVHEIVPENAVLIDHTKIANRRNSSRGAIGSRASIRYIVVNNL
jgi:hypothetical protein